AFSALQPSHAPDERPATYLGQTVLSTRRVTDIAAGCGTSLRLNWQTANKARTPLCAMACARHAACCSQRPPRRLREGAMAEQPVDAIVVGAGLAGLVATYEL